jgi:hypothetical protein
METPKQHQPNTNQTGMFGSDREDRSKSIGRYRDERVVNWSGSLTGSQVRALAESANPWSTDGLLSSLISD